MNIRLIACCLALSCFLVFPQAASAKKVKSVASKPAATAPASTRNATAPVPSPKPAADSAAQGGSVPTDIKADRMEYDADKQTVVFTNNVYVKRPDFEMWSEKLTVYMKKGAKQDKPEKTENKPDGNSVGGLEAGNIDRIVAERNVRMKRDDKNGTCQKATYYTDSSKIVMEGSPVLHDKDNTITGSVITHFIKENRSIADSAIINFKTQDNSDKPGGMPSISPGKGKK